jgi:glycerol-3-phosphate dehydrogenase
MEKAIQLSALNRKKYLEEMTAEPLDLLVVGGGITGAGIAMDGASRGLKVGLIEMQDFASGTSSRSTKLIHGGLRYLKQGDVKLVREVGKERTILYRNAPHIVIPEIMLLPIVSGGTLGKWSTSVALYVYDLLAGVKRKERRIMLSKEDTLKREPLLREDTVKGGGVYFEYRTDDARLTIEVMKTAHSLGALCVNYTKAEQFVYKNEKVVGVEATDLISGEPYTIYAKKVVNAAGPWVDLLRKKDNSLYGKRLHLTKGVHIVVPFERLPLQQAAYFDVSEGRMIFAVPRGGATYIGTTDTNYKGEFATPTVTKEDVSYLLDAVNKMFPTVKLLEKDISSSWAGLRPLIHEDGKSPSQLSRKDEIFCSPSGLLTIAGGKLTGFRKMAERIIDLVIKQLQEESKQTFNYKSSFTDAIVLSGGDFQGPEQIPVFIEEQTREYNDTGIQKKYVKELVGKYGTQAKLILEGVREITLPVDLSTKLIMAELKYGIEEEMVTNLSDFLIRRSGRLFFDRDSISSIYPVILEQLENVFGWSVEEKASYKENFEKEYRAAIQFKEE